MYLPSLENLTSEIDEMISEKKDLFDGSSSSSNSVRIGEEGGGDGMYASESSHFEHFRKISRFQRKSSHLRAMCYSRLACWSQRAESRMSASLIVPFELE